MSVNLVLLGLDGVGKSTIARALQQTLVEEGRSVTITSWSSASKSMPVAFSRDCMADLLYSSFRAMYAGARTEEGHVNAHFPRNAEAFTSSKALKNQFLDFDIVDNETWGVLAGTVTEISGNLMHHFMCVEPQLSSADLVIQESFGYKHLIKDLHLARLLAERHGQDEYLPLIEQLERFGEQVYTTILAPTCGIVVDGDPQAAIGRRLLQSGRAEWTEDYQLAGQKSPESFLAMQTFARKRFLEFAERYGWRTVEVRSEGRQRTSARAVSEIRGAIGL